MCTYTLNKIMHSNVTNNRYVTNVTAGLKSAQANQLMVSTCNITDVLA